MKTILTKTQNPYPIYIENGLLAQLPELTAQINPSCKLAVITDDTVASLYAQSLCDSLKAAGRDVCLYAFPHGEASKNLGTVQKEILPYRGLVLYDKTLLNSSFAQFLKNCLDIIVLYLYPGRQYFLKKLCIF